MLYCHRNSLCNQFTLRFFRVASSCQEGSLLGENLVLQRYFLNLRVLVFLMCIVDVVLDHSLGQFITILHEKEVFLLYFMVQTMMRNWVRITSQLKVQFRKVLV
jgi:hypothetical protein